MVNFGAPHSEYFPRIFLGFTAVNELQLGIGNVFYIPKLTEISNAVSFLYLGCSLQPAASWCCMSSSQNLKVSKVYVPELQKVTVASFSMLEDAGKRKQDFLSESLELTTLPVRNVLNHQAVDNNETSFHVTIMQGLWLRCFWIPYEMAN